MHAISLPRKQVAFGVVERETLRLSGVSVITQGKVEGWDMWANEKLLQDVALAINESQIGIKARFGHPALGKDAIGTELGRFANATVRANSAGNLAVFADIQFVSTAANKDMIDHILTFAEKDPAAIGTSVSMELDFDPEHVEKDYNRAFGIRQKEGTQSADNVDFYVEPMLLKLEAVDFVSTPAANPQGLFSKPPQTRLHNPTPKKMKSVSVELHRRLQRQKADLALAHNADDVAVSFPGDKPEVGDPLVLVDSDGNATGNAPEGIHVLTIDETNETYTVTVDAEGEITEVVAGDESAAEGAEVEAAKGSKAEMAELKAGIAKLEKLLEAKLSEKPANVKPLARGVQAAKPAVKPSTEPVNFQKATIGKDREFDAVIQAVLSHGKLKSMSPAELRQVQLSGKYRNTYDFSSGSGGIVDGGGYNINTDFIGLFTQFLRQLFVNQPFNEDLSRFATTDLATISNGAASVKIGMPALNTSWMELQPGLGCDDEAQVNSLFSGNTYEIVPARVPLKLCVFSPDLGAAYNGVGYEGDYTMPWYTQWLAQLLEQYQALLAEKAYSGSVANGDPFDGWLTQILNNYSFAVDPMAANSFNPSSYSSTVNPNVAFQNFYLNIPRQMKARAQRVGMGVLVANDLLEAYQFYLQTNLGGSSVLAALPQDPNYLPAILGRKTVQSSFLAYDSIAAPTKAYTLASFKDNLRIGTSRSMGSMNVGTFYKDSTGEFEITIRGYYGVGIARQDFVWLGEYAL